MNVFNLCDGHCETTLSLDKKLRCVAIDPHYTKSSYNRRFLVGKEYCALNNATECSLPYITLQFFRE